MKKGYLYSNSSKYNFIIYNDNKKIVKEINKEKQIYDRKINLNFIKIIWSSRDKKGIKEADKIATKYRKLME